MKSISTVRGGPVGWWGTHCIYESEQTPLVELIGLVRWPCFAVVHETDRILADLDGVRVWRMAVGYVESSVFDRNCVRGIESCIIEIHVL